jgi:hypothetical protein
MVLHQEPDVAPPRQQRRAQTTVGEQVRAGIFGQDADRAMGTDQPADNADIVGDAARALLQSAGFEKLRFGDRTEIIGIAAHDSFGLGRGSRLDEIEPHFGEFRDREVALVRVAPAVGEIRLPALEFDIGAGG